MLRSRDAIQMNFFDVVVPLFNLFMVIYLKHVTNVATIWKIVLWHSSTQVNKSGQMNHELHVGCGQRTLRYAIGEEQRLSITILGHRCLAADQHLIREKKTMISSSLKKGISKIFSDCFILSIWFTY